VGASGTLGARGVVLRCHAKSKSTGEQRKAPAVKGWAVCRVHGAGGGQPAGPSHPNYRHGMRTREAIDLRRLVSELAREARVPANDLRRFNWVSFRLKAETQPSGSECQVPPQAEFL